MKRILALVLTLTLLATLFVVPAMAADELVDGKFAEPHKITVEVFDRKNDGHPDPTTSVWADYIKKGMLEQHNVEVEFVGVYRWNEVADLNDLLAANNAPDVCVTYDMPTILSYADMGGVTDLAPYLDQYKDVLPNLWNQLGDYNIYYDQDPETKVLWDVEAKLVNNARINTFIRKDWLDKLNLAMPTTVDEFEACLIAFRDNAETLLGADAARMIPYSTSYDIGWRNNTLAVSYIDEAISDKDLYINGYDDRQVLQPGYKEGIRVLNKWYNEGLVWKDFALYGSGDTTEDNMIKAGFVGAFAHNYDYPFRGDQDSIIANLKRNVGEEATFVAVDCFKNNAGVYRKYLSDTVDRKVFFPATNDEILASLLYLDFISSPEVILYLQTGVEAINHVRGEDGAYIMQTIPTTSENAAYIISSASNIDFTITNNGLNLGDYTQVSFAYTYPGIDPQLMVDAYNIAMNGGRVPAHYSLPAIEAEVGIGTSLNEKRNTFLNKAVVAPVDQFDAVWDAGVADWLASGGQAIIDERAEKLAQYFGE